MAILELCLLTAALGIRLASDPVYKRTFGEARPKAAICHQLRLRVLLYSFNDVIWTSNFLLLPKAYAKAPFQICHCDLLKSSHNLLTRSACPCGLCTAILQQCTLRWLFSHTLGIQLLPEP